MNRIQPATGTEPATSDDTATEDAWFLTPQERGNPATTIDRRRGDGRAWTAGNQVVPLIHGRTYFAELLGCLRAMRAGDVLMFTDWRGDGDERLGDGPGTELATVLADLARADVDVRGLVWRSHEGSGRFSEHEHIELAERVNDGRRDPAGRTCPPERVPPSEARAPPESDRTGTGGRVRRRHRPVSRAARR
jgi:hypothetical protein